MSRALPVLLPLVLASITSTGAAQRPLTENTFTRGEDFRAPAATVDDLLWIVGHWRGEGLGGLNEEIWSPPLGGTLMGVYRLVRDGSIVLYEILTVGPEGGSLLLTLRHFDPDLVAWEERTGPLRLPLLRLEEDGAWFEGLTFRRDGPDGLTVFVAMAAGEGPPREAVFTYRRHDGP
jgi:hypothetical protein